MCLHFSVHTQLDKWYDRSLYYYVRTRTTSIQLHLLPLFQSKNSTRYFYFDSERARHFNFRHVLLIIIDWLKIYHLIFQLAKVSFLSLVRLRGVNDEWMNEWMNENMFVCLSASSTSMTLVWSDMIWSRYIAFSCHSALPLCRSAS